MKFVSLRLKVQWWVVNGYKLQYIIYLDLPPRFLLLGRDGPIEAFRHPHFNEIYQDALMLCHKIVKILAVIALSCPSRPIDWDLKLTHTSNTLLYMPFTGFSIWKQTPLKKTFNFISKLPLLICKLEYLMEEIFKIYYHLQNFS